MKQWSTPHDNSIELVDSRYDEWRERFVAERDRIRHALVTRDLGNQVNRLEYVGSTAVPALASKDIVDIDVVVADDVVSEVASAIVSKLGGSRTENTTEWHPVFRVHDGQRFNDHVFAALGDRWKLSVVTRDVLRARPNPPDGVRTAETRTERRARRPRRLFQGKDGVHQACDDDCPIQ